MKFKVHEAILHGRVTVLRAFIKSICTLHIGDDVNKRTTTG